MQNALWQQSPDQASGRSRKTMPPRRRGGVIAALRSLLRRSGGRATSAWPVLHGFYAGQSLALPPGDIFAQEGVQLHSSPDLGDRVVALCEEAWIAGRYQQECWYALWCPYAGRWEMLRFELDRPRLPAARQLARRALRARQSRP